MKKSIIIVISIVIILILAVGSAYLIDMNRMTNNKPVIFSTWGYSYVQPVVLGKVTKITDRTIEEDLICAQALELFYEDDKNEYYFNCIKSQLIIVEYENGYKEDVKSAFANGHITLEDLDRFDVGYITEKKTLETSQKDIVTITHGKVENIEKIDTFINNTNAESLNRQNDFIRIIQYTIEGDPIITDIKYIHSDSESEAYYEVTIDSTADKFGRQTVEKNEYKGYTIRKEENNSYVDIYLYPLLLEELEPIFICSISSQEFNSNTETFRISVVASEKLEKKKILNNAELNKINSKYYLYYYGIDEVNVQVNDKEMSLEEALRNGYLSIEEIIEKADEDATMAAIRKLSYDDGGTTEYHYQEYTIIKCNTLVGNRDVYICKAGTNLNDLDI